MPSNIRPNCRALFLASTTLAALTTGAVANDLPATPEGAAKITAFIETYAGKSASVPPALEVTPEGSDYLVTADMAALTASLNRSGVNYDPVVFKFKVFEQDDAMWRIEIEDFPPYHAKITQNNVTADVTASVSGLKSTTLLDTARDWIRSGQTNADKFDIHERLPGIDAVAGGGPLQAAMTTQASPDGAVSTSMQESLGALEMTAAVDPKAANPSAAPNAQPFNVAARIDSGAVDLKLDGIKPRPLLDLWAFLVAHPSRAELAADEAALKTLLTAALPAQTAFAEEGAVQKLSVQTSQGSFTFDGAKVGVSVAAAGPASRFEEHFAATGLALPPGLVPAQYQDFVPTSFDLGFKVSGFDLNAAGTEAIADMHLAGDSPPISPEDKAKVSAKLMGAGPVLVDIPPSHFLAPQIDIGFEGQIRYLGPGKSTGTITVHVRNFDKTTGAALKAAGPEQEKKLVPLIAMVKGLAKTAPDGVMTWVTEVGDDRVMKVNGLPLGKAPF